MRRQRRRRALGRLRRQRRARRHEEGRDPRRPHHGVGDASPANCSRRQREGHRLRRRAGLRRPGGRGQRAAGHHVRRRAGDLRQGEAGARRLRQDVRADRRARAPGQLTKMVNQICIAGIAQGLAEGARLREEKQPGSRESRCRDLERRGAVLADGQPLEADERAQGRGLRLRHRMDAQGRRHLPRPGEAVRRAPAGDRARRPVLRPPRSARRQALGQHLRAHPAAVEGLALRDEAANAEAAVVAEQEGFEEAHRAVAPAHCEGRAPNGAARFALSIARFSSAL